MGTHVYSKPFNTFATEVDLLMQKRYGITWVDACGDNELLTWAFKQTMIPSDFVEWYGQKYDLTRIDE